MAQNSIERAIAKQQQEAKRLYDKQQREARKNAEKDERRQRASMIVNGQPINYGMRIMDKSAEEILELILSVYDGAETRFVKGSQDVFPEAYQQSMALEFEKLSMYGMITGHRIWVTGFWELYITPQGLTYFEDKEKAMAIID